MALPYHQDIRGARVPDSALHAHKQALKPFLEQLRTAPAAPAAALFASTRADDELQQAVALGKEWRQRFKHLLVLGAGGSGLSGKALACLLPGTGTHTLHVADNLDPAGFAALLEQLPLHETCFFLVSKSGGTVETYAQSVLLLARLAQQHITDLPNRMALMAMPGDNPLCRLIQGHALPFFAHDPELCGRFSIFSAVGALPAIFLGLDASRLRQGAADSLKENLGSADSPAVTGAALSMAQMQNGCHTSVFTTYSAEAWGLALWWRQGWAESLGKKGQGTTPVLALGPADQHSQLQLWLDGPEGKCHTILSAGNSGLQALPPVPPPFAHLSGKTLADIVEAQCRATAETLIARGRPVRRIHVPHLDEYALGALLMHFALEIFCVAELLGINPFDQPAVEESKKLAHQYLSGL